MNSDNKLRYFFVPYQCFDKFSGQLVGQGVLDCSNPQMKEVLQNYLEVCRIYEVIKL